MPVVKRLFLNRSRGLSVKKTLHLESQMCGIENNRREFYLAVAFFCAMIWSQPSNQKRTFRGTLIAVFLMLGSGLAGAAT
jgi:hypothetical protein